MANCTNRFYAEDQDGNELSFGVGVAIYKYHSGSWHWVINKWIDSSSGASTSLTAGGTYKAVPDTENSNYVTPDEETWTACRKDITLVYEKIICTAGDKKCIGSDVYKCNRDGTEWRLSERCPDGCTGGECDEVVVKPDPIITSIGTTDVPKLCEPITFTNVVEWDDDGGDGKRAVSWQYTKDTKEYDGCGSGLFWSQFSTEQWATHTFDVDDADITRIRCIVTNKHGNHDCAMIPDFAFDDVERTLYQVAWELFLTEPPSLILTHIVLALAVSFAKMIEDSMEGMDKISPIYAPRSRKMEESYWICKNACDKKLGDALAEAIIAYRQDVTEAEEALEADKERFEEENTYIEFSRETDLRRIELTLFEECLEGLLPTGDLHCTSNQAFFYVDLNGSMAGFSYANKLLVFKLPVGDVVVKIYKGGCVPESCKRTVTIVEGDTKTFNCNMTEAGECSPITNVKIYTDPLSPTTDDTVSFNGSANCGDPIDSWEWDFGDGHTATGQAVTHRYRHDGVYTVKLAVSSECASEFTARNITVSEEGCSPVTNVNIYTDPLSPKNDQIVSFNGSARSYDPLKNWEWDFGDGHTATGQAVTHRYTSAGVYTVELTVTNDCEESESTERNITVSEETPTGGSTTLSIPNVLYRTH